MKVNKKIILLLILLIFCSCLIYVKADSGWDSSYDLGGWDSGSWDSDFGGSSWDNDSWGGSSYSSSHSVFGIIQSFIVFIVLLYVVFKYIQKTKRKLQKNINMKKRYNNFFNFKDIDISKLTNIDSTLDISEFKIEAFDIYKNIQEAWMNFDNEKIRELTTDELYNMYSSQLEILKIKNQKNIMSNITKEDVKIIDVSYDDINKIISIDVYLKVSCLDYVINEKTNKVVRGTKDRKLIIEYIVTFVKSSDNKEAKCPNCGAPIEINGSNICSYCKSTLVKVSSKYVMSKKKCIRQTFGGRK